MEAWAVFQRGVPVARDSDAHLTRPPAFPRILSMTELNAVSIGVRGTGMSRIEAMKNRLCQLGGGPRRCPGSPRGSSSDPSFSRRIDNSTSSRMLTWSCAGPPCPAAMPHRGGMNAGSRPGVPKQENAHTSAKAQVHERSLLAARARRRESADLRASSVCGPPPSRRWAAFGIAVCS